MNLRLATHEDLDAIARVFSPSVRLLTFLPELHTPDEERWFMEHVLFPECKITVTEIGGAIISFMARADREIRLLHTHPAFIGRGAGKLLIEDAKVSGEQELYLWCFQANILARHFYERQGFIAAEFTNGQRNDEKTPDVRYVWTRGDR
jgi:GNAT superfamily N-acetyltransferase